MPKACNCGQTHWWSHCAWRGECGPCPIFALYLAFTLQLRKNHRKTSVVYPKVPSCSVLGTIRYVELATKTVANLTSLLILVTLMAQAARVNLDQCSNLLSFWTKGFPTSANFESKLLVRTTMWSAKNGTPKSSWIFLLPCSRVHPWWKL